MGIVIRLQIDVLEYPENEGVLRRTIECVKQLAAHLSLEERLGRQLDPVGIASARPTWPGYLRETIDFCVQTKGHLASLWLLNIIHVVKCPTDVQIARTNVGTEGEFLAQRFADAAERSASMGEPPNALFVALRDAAVSVGPSMWGECRGTYPLTVALETRGYRESVFHECLHQFGVSEGYDLSTKKPLPGCESCWMQYVGTCGNNLCSRHTSELHSFLKGLKA
jgi:hypothetical protein